MVNRSKRSDKLNKPSEKELDAIGAKLVISVPSAVYMKIREAGKLKNFEEAILNNGTQFAFDIEQFCQDTGIQLSKEQRRLCALEFEKLGKYLRPRLVK